MKKKKVRTLEGLVDFMNEICWDDEIEEWNEFDEWHEVNVCGMNKDVIDEEWECIDN